MAKHKADKKHGEYEVTGAVITSMKDLPSTSAGGVRLRVWYTAPDGQSHETVTASDEPGAIEVRNAMRTRYKGKRVTLIMSKAARIKYVNEEEAEG